jgi:hypothetical protein
MFDTADEFNVGVAGIRDRYKRRIGLCGHIPVGSNCALLQDLLGSTREIAQIGNWDDILPVLCAALEEEDSVITRLYIWPMQRAQCNILARAISNNASLDVISITGCDRSAASTMISNLKSSPMNTGRVGEIHFRF